jgi:hypothetical protein
MNNRNRLLQLFQQNTDGKTTITPPRVEPGKCELYGYQVPRMDKYKWQGRV